MTTAQKRGKPRSNMEADAGIVITRHADTRHLDDIDLESLDDNDAQDALDEMGLIDGIAAQTAIEEMDELDDELDSADVVRRLEQTSSFDKDEPDSLLGEVDPAPPRGD